VTSEPASASGGHDLGDGLRRSVALIRAFRVEQTDPDRFYSLLAADSVTTLRDVIPLERRLVVDVGAGPEQFARAFRAAGARYLPVDHDPSVASVQSGGVVATAAALPFADDTVDVVFTSNLLEHVEEPEAVADELLRVVRRGGVLVISYTNWLSPWGGHETSPYHWLGGRRAHDRYTRKHGHPPKNRIDVTLFRVSVRQMLAWVRGVEADDRVDVLRLQPRYLPGWARHVLRLPGVREVLTWNLLIVLRKR
jgi:SAM-dependent methyltransferase